MSDATPVVRVSPHGVVRVLWLVTAALVALHVTFMVLRFGFGRDSVFGVARFFNLDAERSVPTFFGALLLGVAAALLGLCAAHHRRARDPMASRWSGLTWVFVFLSLDEIAGIHERVGRALRLVTTLDDWIYFVWPVPAIVLVAVLYLVYRPWFAALDPSTRRGVDLAGAVFILGAVGMELLGGIYWAHQAVRRADLVYMSITTVEETLEMVGMVLFIGVMLHYLAARGWGLAVGMAPAVPPEGQRRPPG